jgi:predicted dehydrogenase
MSSRELFPATRRAFLESAAATVVAAGTLSLAQSAHAAGNDLLRVGLVGCGGRGTGAAGQALKADSNVKLTAMGDAFADRLEGSLGVLTADGGLKEKIDVPPERQFVGFNAYEQVIANCDVVLLCTPPQFRPLHIAAAVASGKHVFAEKPVAVDAPGVKSVLKTCELAKQKRLSVVSGLCLRYDLGFRETVRRLQDGQAGEIHTLLANDYRGGIWIKPRQPDWTDMHWQMRNWYYFTWLSGDFNVEQHVHFLDVGAWIMRDEYPVKAIGMGGRQVRTGPEYGNIYDHFSIVYEWKNGTRMFSNCRQQPGCKNVLSAQAVGSKGRSDLSEKRNGLWIDAGDKWTYDGPANDMYQAEHDAFFASIRRGEPINNGEYMSYSTLLAIMGRMAAYTGQEITWEQALHSQQDLTPAKYDWGPAPEVIIAQPGKTKFV